MTNISLSDFRQCLAAFIVNLSTFNYGTLVGWPSPMQPLLQSQTNPAIGKKPLTDNMLAWAGSLTYIGAAVGCCFWAPLANKVGRKKTSILIVIPFVVSWCLMCFTNSFLSLCLARIIGGIGNAGSVINSPMYVTEICRKELKSGLGTLIMLISCAGVLNSYIFGSILPFNDFNNLNLTIAVVSVLVTFYLPESPVFHMKCHQMDRAKKSLIWLRNYNVTKEKHKRLLCHDIENLESSFLNRTKETKFKDIWIPSTRNAVFIGLGLISSMQMCGISVITINSVHIFQSAEIKLHPFNNSITAFPLTPAINSVSLPNITTFVSPSNESSISRQYFSSTQPANMFAIIIASLQLIAAFFSIYLVNIAGRKVLLITSYSFIALSLYILGMFYYLKQNEFVYLHRMRLVPVVSLSIYIIAYISSAGPVTYIILSEIFPAETRNVCMGIVMFYQQLIMFFLIKSFPNLKGLVGMYGCMWVYASSTLVCIIAIYLYVPETRGKSFQEILKQLTSKPIESNVIKYSISADDIRK